MYQLSAWKVYHFRRQKRRKNGKLSSKEEGKNDQTGESDEYTFTAYPLKNPQKIYKIKKRKTNKELTVIANSLSIIKKYCYINKIEKKLTKKYWPGPLSIVLNVKPKFQKILGQTLAVRVPANKIARELSKKLNKPLIATSANLAGKATCYNIKNVLKQFSKSKIKPDIIIDDGDLERVPVSTIVRVGNGKVETLRKGNILVNNE